MKDNMKPCQHTLSEDVAYKEVVVIGNGPSGMVTSFMLAGNVPYLKEIPEDLPIDDMLRARLSNLPQGQNLYEADLLELAEGLEGRSQNPLPLLMDNLLRPCADLGIQADPLIEWRYDVEKQIDHIVLGRGPPGGAWHTFPPGVRTLSPGAWLTLPPHTTASTSTARLSARAVATYCRRYVHACKLQRYFRSGVVVTSVTLAPRSTSSPCAHASCPLNAVFCVSGYDKGEGRMFRYLCRRVVLASGAGDRPNTLEPDIARQSLHSLSTIERAIHQLSTQPTATPPTVLVVGSGVSAADAAWLGLRAKLNVAHVHRAPAPALARLEPQQYPDYCQIYKMMCDGPRGNYPNYTSFSEHTILEVTPETTPEFSPKLTNHIEDDALRLKRVKLLNLVTKEITEITVNLISVLIGSKPDLFFLQTNFNLDCIDVCKWEEKTNDNKCFLKNHWSYIKSVLGQSIQSCKSRYLNYTEINGNDSKCIIPECKSDIDKLERNDKIIPFNKCECESDPYSSGLGFGIDPKKPVDGRSNPVAIDKSTHELLTAPKGMYALGPLTADNFVRFIPGGALALVANMHKEMKNTTE